MQKSLTVYTILVLWFKCVDFNTLSNKTALLLHVIETGGDSYAVTFWGIRINHMQFRNCAHASERCSAAEQK